VLNPADIKALYFVADGAGGHVFSETLKDHNTNVQKWRATEKDLKGKATPPAADTPTTAAPPSAVPKTRAVVRTVPPAKAPPPADKAPEPAPPKR